MSEGWTVGPTSKESLRETPVEDFAEASNTTLSLVVCSLLCARRAWGDKRFLGWLLQVCSRYELGMVEIDVLIHYGSKVNKPILGV